MNYISKRAKVVSDKPAYKKKEKSESGGTIYRYDEKHIKKRWDQKKEQIKKLEKNIGKLKSAIDKDLDSDDERTRAIAAIVGVMEESYMRIGNEDSAKEGTYGASTLKKRHIKSSGGKMKFDFPGKGSIEQHVEITNKKVIKVIKDLIKDKKADDFVFEVDGKKIWDRAVNRYLSPHDISAKDLRGFGANQLMKDVLKKQKDFKKALDEVAEIVGHEPATLKNQYLDPELVEKYEGKGKKDDKKKKSALSIRHKQAELTPEDKEWLRSIKQKSTDTGRTTNVNQDFKKSLNIGSNVKLNQLIFDAWRTLRPFLPDSVKLTSGARTPEDQKRILDNYFYKATGNRVPDHLKSDDKVWGQVSNILKQQHGLIVGPPWSKSRYSHLNGNAFDISGGDLSTIAATVAAVSEHPDLPVKFRKPLVEWNNNAVHVGVEQASYNPEAISRVMGSGKYSSLKEDMIKCGVDKDVAENFESTMEDADWDEIMGFGLDDEMGDWFEKAPMFRFREEEAKPDHEIHDVSDSEAKKLIEEEPEKFFYRGLHKEFPDLESEALEKVIETNAKFFFVFRYHEKEDEDFQELVEKAAELLSQQDSRAFFYYHLHHKFPELGRGAIVQLIDTNPDTYFDLGLQKDYPDYEDSANSARNIKDPNKIELELPEWMENESEKPLSMRDRNAANKLIKMKRARWLSKRGAKPYGWWLSPTGEFHEVKPFGHMDFVEKNRELIGLPSVEEQKFVSYNDAFGKGWIRVVNRGMDRSISFETPSMSDQLYNHIRTSIKNSPFDIGEVCIDASPDHICSMINTFMKARNFEALKNIVRRYAGISKRAGTPYGWWISSSGEMVPVDFHEHIVTIIKDPAKFGINLDEFSDEEGNVFGYQLYDAAFANGWTRVAMQSNTRVSAEVPEFNNKYLRILKDSLFAMPLQFSIDVSSPGSTARLGPVPIKRLFEIESFRDMGMDRSWASDKLKPISKRAK